jgi:hypothetical protein
MKINKLNTLNRDIKIVWDKILNLILFLMKIRALLMMKNIIIGNESFYGS